MDLDLLCMSSSKNSPVKLFRESDSEESPIKTPTTKSRLNLGNLSSSHRKVLNFSNGRVLSNSNLRPRGGEDESKVIRKQWLEGLEKFGLRSISRDVSGKYTRKDENDVEVKLLNSKIKSLIRENFELKAQVELNNHRIRTKGATDKVNSNYNEGFSFEVTFGPKELLEEVFRNKKKFPRDVFRLPRARNSKKEVFGN